MQTSRARFDALFDKHEALIKAAFLTGVEDLTVNIGIGDITSALERGDITGAVDAMHIELAAFRALTQALENSFADGGENEADQLNGLRRPEGGRLVVRFDPTEFEAHRALTIGQTGIQSGLVSSTGIAIVAGLVLDKRISVRRALSDGLDQGMSPRIVALNTVGRRERASRRRIGGILGLSGPQEGYVASAREELRSGDPARMSNYLNRGRRDGRFDRTVIKAINAKKALPADTAEKLVGRYSERLLDLRANTIARTETLRTLNAGADQAVRQAIRTGQIADNEVDKKWLSSRDERVRDTHSALDGETIAVDEAFQSPSGASLMYPGDGPASESANCRCSLTHVVKLRDRQ